MRKHRALRTALFGPGIASACDQQARGLFASRGEALSNIVPVHDVPESLDVVGLDVLVVEVERMLPHVEQQDRHSAGSELRLLVEELLDDEVLADRVPEQAGPAGALDAQSGSVELTLEALERTEVLFDRSSNLALGTLLALRAQVRPEYRVVRV